MLKTEEPLKASSLLDPAFADSIARDKLPRGEMLNEVQEIMDGLRAALNEHIAAIEASRQEAQDKLTDLRNRWTTATDEVRAKYDEVVRALHAKGLDATRYLAVTKRLAILEAEVPRREALQSDLQKLRDDRRQLLAEQTELDGRARRRLGNAARAANDLVKGYVIVKPIRGRDRAPLDALISQHVSGARTQIVAAVHKEDFSPQAFAAACRSGDAATLERAHSIRGAQATALLRTGEALYLELEEQVIGLAAEAQLNVATIGAPRHKSLDNLSKGQKATALLLLLLSSAASPLIIDQPEDNLDNRFVFDGVVRRLRELKGARQLILSTHNANIPVLGDAELVVALESEDDRGRVVDGGLGSIDDETVRQLVTDVLEGGHEAFDARAYLYGY